MEKQITYKGQEYTIDIKWSGSCYSVMIIGVSGYNPIPMNCLNDIEKIKPYIIDAIERPHDLHQIENWNGVL